MLHWELEKGKVREYNVNVLLIVNIIKAIRVARHINVIVRAS